MTRRVFGWSLVLATGALSAVLTPGLLAPDVSGDRCELEGQARVSHERAVELDPQGRGAEELAGYEQPHQAKPAVAAPGTDASHVETARLEALRAARSALATEEAGSGWKPRRRGRGRGPRSTRVRGPSASPVPRAWGIPAAPHRLR